MAYTEGLPTPPNYRLWSAIAALAGVMERKLFSRTGRKEVFPSLYVALTGKPSAGKTVAIDRVKDLWMSTKSLHVAPTSMTSASMLDVLMEADRKIFAKGQLSYEYHSMVIPAGEFSVFCNAFDKEYLGRLCDIWDCTTDLRVRRKYIKEEVSIVNPQITLLAGVQPGFLHSVLPEEAWNMGFPARLMLVYAEEAPKVKDLFEDPPVMIELRKRLVADLLRLMSEKVQGQLLWELKAQAALMAWYRAGFPPVPSHERLEHYCGKRITYIIKLSMISAASRDLCASMAVTLDDFERARRWMLDAEATMPEVFTNMIVASDAVLINETYHYITRHFIKTHRPCHTTQIWEFMRHRIKSVDRVPKIIEAMVNAGIIARMRGEADLFIPKVKNGSEA